MSAPILPPNCFGTGRNVLDTLSALKKKRIDTFVIGDLTQQKFRGYNTNKTKTKNNNAILTQFFLNYKKALKQIEKNADIYQNNIYLNKRAKIPTLTVTNFLSFTQFKRGKFFFKKIDKQILKKSDKIISVSPLIEKELLSAGINEEKILTIPPGIWFDHFHSNKKRNYVLFSGRFSRDKNFKTLMSASKDFKSKLFVTGKKVYPIDYTPRKEYPNARIFGFVPREIQKLLLSSARVFVLPSKYETFGIAALESMASGVPTIVSKNAGVSYYLKDGKDALIIEPTKEAIIEAVNELLTNDSLWKRLSKKGRKKAKEFDWNKNINKYIKVYKSLLKS